MAHTHASALCVAPQVVAKLLECGRSKESRGLTALHLAAQNGLEQVCAGDGSQRLFAERFALC